MLRLTRVRLLVCAAILAFACASGGIPPIQQVQVSHDALATAQDLEVQLCLGVPNVAAASALPVVNKCSTPIAVQVGLTDARHQAIQRQFVIAVGLHKSITAQFAAGATHVDLTSLQAAISAILTEVALLTPLPPVVQLQAQVKAAQVGGSR